MADTELRLDVLNIGDKIYEFRNGTGVGVGAPQLAFAARSLRVFYTKPSAMDGIVMAAPSYVAAGKK